jgi:hypothetical protein
MRRGRQWLSGNGDGCVQTSGLQAKPSVGKEIGLWRALALGGLQSAEGKSEL